MGNSEGTPPESAHDTQPRRPPNFPSGGNYDGVPAPPRILLWGVVGLFILGVLGTIGGVVVFREVMTPGQQARVMDRLPFMEAFLPPRPGADDTLATAGPVDEEAAHDLLFGFQLGDEEAEATPGVTPEPEQTPEPEPEETQETALEIAAAPTATAEAPTPEPTTATPLPEPTAVQVEEAQRSQQDVHVSSSARTWSTTAYNSGFRYERQTWNNCGPANITMALSYFGWTRDHVYAAGFLKPDREDKNVSPHEMVAFVNEQTDVRALWRMGGDLDLLRKLIDNGFPVVIERSHVFEGGEWLGHYQTLVGYDDSQARFYIFDSWLGIGDGAGINETYDEVDRAWRHFNRIFVVVYEPARESQLMQLLGSRVNPQDAAQHAFSVAQDEALANREDPFAWFNMGTSLTELGLYNQAANAFDQAIRIGVPWRMLWYQFGPYEAYYNERRYDDVLHHVRANLNNGGQWVEETYYWQGRALAAQGNRQQAAAAFQTALRRNRNFEAARQALDNLNS
jgi:hypothetical protein